MRFQKADPKAKTKWRFSRLIALFLAVLPAAAVILLISSAVAEEAWEPAGTLGIIAAAVLVAAQLLQIILYPVIQYAQWQYLIAPDRIEIRQGIFFRTHTVIPIARVQYASVTQSALQKPFDLANVQIHTAGDVMEIAIHDCLRSAETPDFLALVQQDIEIVRAEECFPEARPVVAGPDIRRLVVAERIDEPSGQGQQRRGIEDGMADG